MITDVLLNFFVWVADTFTSWLPDLSPPAWVSQIGNLTGIVFTNANQMGAWLPLGFLFTVFTAWMTCVFAGLTVKLVRIAVSLFTGGGGNA